jgi:hypothetical protein
MTQNIIYRFTPFYSLLALRKGGSDKACPASGDTGANPTRAKMLIGIVIAFGLGVYPD